jgi:hypothetical protein
MPEHGDKRREQASPLSIAHFTGNRQLQVVNANRGLMMRVASLHQALR